MVRTRSCTPDSPWTETQLLLFCIPTAPQPLNFVVNSHHDYLQHIKVSTSKPVSARDLWCQACDLHCTDGLLPGWNSHRSRDLSQVTFARASVQHLNNASSLPSSLWSPDKQLSLVFFQHNRDLSSMKLLNIYCWCHNSTDLPVFPLKSLSS